MRRYIDAPEKEFLTVEEAADWLGVPHVTFRGWLDGGLIPPPRRLNVKVRRYPWAVVVAIGVLLGYGTLPGPAGEGKKDCPG